MLVVLVMFAVHDTNDFPKMQAFDELFRPFLTHYLNSASMLQKFLTAVVVEEWARDHDNAHQTVLLEVCPLARDLSAQLLSCLQSETPIAYHEMVFLLSRLHVDCYNLLHSFVTDCRVAVACIPELGTEIDPTGEKPTCFTIHTAREAVGRMFDELKNMLGRTKKKEIAGLVDRRNAIAASIERFFDTKSEYDIRVSAGFAAAYIALKATPEKVSPIVKGIMNGVKVYMSISQLLAQTLTVFALERGESAYPDSISHCCFKFRRFLCTIQPEPATRENREEPVHFPVPRH